MARSTKSSFAIWIALLIPFVLFGFWLYESRTCGSEPIPKHELHMSEATFKGWKCVNGKWQPQFEYHDMF